MAPDAVTCAIFLLLAFTLAGFAQTAWFRHPWSRACAAPIDGGLTLRGRRLFGDNKTLRGFVVMVPAAAAAFALLSTVMRVWPLSMPQYALLGAWAGLGFMAGELPNSFVKRQLDIAPGHAAGSVVATAMHFLIDRIDSGIGMLAALAVVVPVPWQTWAIVLLVGPAIHWSFSLLMFRLGVKARAA
jgi:CDP-2,3-bis-(O-geranylgeranyl)-sn-glycerol synthase